ncbi:hypothetical protein EVAR_60934_1 [Eumeta japonica]|uniref:Uncharacterized protein n=1 Tax=Eumeta variegata TaxID=151549 RepID=A0A4C1ZIQ9_EUMVA|nr:hypothetical protein EVAR_60934_1 [Eumeta japonica]
MTVGTTMLDIVLLKIKGFAPKMLKTQAFQSEIKGLLEDMPQKWGGCNLIRYQQTLTTKPTEFDLNSWRGFRARTPLNWSLMKSSNIFFSSN